MPKSDLNAAVEKIADKLIAKRLRECRMFPKIAAMIQSLQEQCRSMKKDIDELKIMVRKINLHGPTPRSDEKTDNATGGGKRRGGRQPRTGNAKPLSPVAIQRIRKAKNLTQGQMSALLGVKWQRFANWEQGRAKPSPDFDSAIRAIGELNGRELRSKLADLGIFQTSGKRKK